MIRNISFVIIFITLVSCSEGSLTIPIQTKPKIELIKTIGGTNNEAAQSIVKTSDGGYAILGYTQSNDNDVEYKNDTSFDYYVLKFSSEDVLQWSKTYGGSGDDRGKSIIQTQDGGFAIFGYSKSNDLDVTNNAGDRDFWLAKLDENGNLSWQKSFGFQGRDDGTKLIETNDGGYLITGELDVTASGGEGNSRTANRHAGGDYWVIKLDNIGNKEWSKYYGGNFTDTPQGIAKTSDGGYIITGTSDSSDVDITNNKGTYDFWIIRISSTGDLIWEKNFGGSEIDEARAISTINDGNFIIVGDTRSTDIDVSLNNGGADLWLIKISPEGNLLWEKSFGGSSFDVARSISKTNDGGFIISGSSRSIDNGFTNQGENDAWILKISSEGNQEWQQIIGGSNIDFLYDAVELNDGTVIAVGESSSNDGDILLNRGFSDLLIIKLK
ncbi:hypothetical protein C7447_101623 [Tenacibaculum adriaticum]|uniref:Bulb-type lectin domain-containing protein n=1 Tax=Tenacibaculum adriaticum TaxID=413713 RepID=A0A5S5DWA7_9FLAO|nr:hypothetical protein [Tenacibaculum adriaticum]TYQ00015.1 hypothetical protein C7447_101623 [Tenacibaculum adriaticum]